jgi:hypothetical protein
MTHRKMVPPIIAIAAFVFASCGNSVISGAAKGHVRTHGASASQPASIPASELTTISLPTGYPRPTNIVASNGSAWWWGNSATQTTLFHWVPGSGLSSIPLGTPTGLGLTTGSQNAITVDSTGNVWLGANLTLLQYDPATRGTASITIPATPLDSAGDATKPQNLQGLEAISALASDGEGNVAIAISGSSEVLEMSSASHGFTATQLPSATEASDLAFSRDGTLGVTLQSVSGAASELLVRSPSGSTSTTTTPNSPKLAAQQNTFLLDGDSNAVSSNGAQSPNAAMSATMSSSTSNNLTLGGAIAAGPAGAVLMQTIQGLSIEQNGTLSLLNLPEINCGLGAPQLPGSEASTSQMCAASAELITTDASGNAFFVPTPGSPKVDYLSAQAITGAS